MGNQSVFMESEAMKSAIFNMHCRLICRQGSTGISKDLFSFFWSEMKGGSARER